MKILALDTATEACSVALNIDGQVNERYDLLPRRHSRELLPMVDNLLIDAGLTLGDIDALAFGCGPGAFTGLRVAAAMTQGLAFALDIPVIPVSTLASLAQQGFRVYGATHIISAIDARMDEVYWGSFVEDNNHMVSMIDEVVIAPEHAIIPILSGSEVWLGLGSGWCYKERLPVVVFDYYEHALPHAMDIALLAAVDYKRGHLISAEKAMPVYLRNKVALKKSER